MAQKARKVFGRFRFAAIGGGLFIAAIAPAQAGQSQGQMAVSAYVIVTSAISAALSQAPPTQFVSDPAQAVAPATSTPVETPADPESPRSDASICATVAVSCSSRTPMRINVDGNPESSGGGQCGSQDGAQKSISLCASAAANTAELSINIEY